MREYYTYDELYGTLLRMNDDDTERVYFCVECDAYKFYKWMFSHGWNKAGEKVCEHKGLKGSEITLHR